MIGLILVRGWFCNPTQVASSKLLSKVRAAAICALGFDCTKQVEDPSCRPGTANIVIVAMTDFTNDCLLNGRRETRATSSWAAWEHLCSPATQM